MSVSEHVQSNQGATRLRSVKRVLWAILGLNILVALAKLSWGLLSNSTAMTADGVHSLFDGTSNIVGLVGLGFAARPADADHPYGHTKYETFASVVISLMLGLTAYSLGKEAILKLLGQGEPPVVTTMSFVIMIGTLGVNIGVASYERRAAKRLNSDILLADANHTASDVLVSVGVIISLVLVRIGFPIADGIVSMLVAVAITLTAWDVLKHANATLSDSARIPVEGIHECALSVAGIRGSHHIRTRGTSNEVYVDLHVLVDPQLTVKVGHQLAHTVEKCIQAKYPQAIDVVVHVEPDDDENPV